MAGHPQESVTAHRSTRTNPVEADHGRLKAWLRPMHGIKRRRSAWVLAAGHAFVQNLRREHYDIATETPSPHRLRLGSASSWTPLPSPSETARHWNDAPRTKGRHNATVPLLATQVSANSLMGGEEGRPKGSIACIDLSDWTFSNTGVSPGGVIRATAETASAALPTPALL